jgi:hypothetical protein
MAGITKVHGTVVAPSQRASTITFFQIDTGVDLTSSPAAANSPWSKAIRALQVTSELFAVFAPDYDTTTEGASTFCFMAPDFNTNTGAAPVAGSAQSAIANSGGDFSVLETAIQDACGGTATVTRVALTGVTVA